MKKLALASALVLAATAAQAYQTEVQGTVGYYDAELNDGNYNAGVQGTYYFKDLDTSKGPLAEAAFLNQATSVSAAYSYGELTSDVNKTISGHNIKGEVEVEQQSYGIKGETYIPTSIVPVYASASYNHSKTKVNDFATQVTGQTDDSGDRYALEVGAMVTPNLLVAAGYTNIAAHQSLDTFNLLNNGFMLATMEARSINDDKDAFTARTKYLGAIDGTNMFIGFEAGLVYGEESMYQLKSDLYVTPKLGFGVSYTEGSYKSATIPTSAVGVNASYFVTPNISVGANYVYANGETGAPDAQLGGLNAKFRF